MAPPEDRPECDPPESDPPSPPGPRYNHYYSVRDPTSAEWQAAWPRLVLDLRNFFEAILSFWLPQRPIIGDEGIFVDWRGDSARDNLEITRTGPTSLRVVCMSRRDMDMAVSCILLRAVTLAPAEFQLRSDGPWDGEHWLRARFMSRRQWPDEVGDDCPWAQYEEAVHSE
ncbi:hypothetical protein BO70DRAFT_356276 [Aspergillus heteromorphus CBS 117.55]|uniref:Uncharacterized protein n=1 Tax=Aspergillus heteromorphus CBS 117.55 TaxID=1448321 RepID=A0A317V0T8_9EURO|nr:uncharacterized protein BO70DRAFT_356276 [Aspergillus heteromorphus CBS 117.55]PWY67944.1 hypothetical protein BO70DRAFT_356276 [Aspergillus heteromorphus CBS 117.55]